MPRLSSFFVQFLILLQICIGLSIVNSEPKPQLNLPPLRGNFNQSNGKSKVPAKNVAVKIIGKEINDGSDGYTGDDGDDDKSIEINGKLGVSSDYDRERRQKYGPWDFDRDRSQRYGPPYAEDDRYYQNNLNRDNDYNYNQSRQYNNEEDKYYANPNPARDPNYDFDRDRYGNRGYGNPNFPREPNYDYDRDRYGNRVNHYFLFAGIEWFVHLVIIFFPKLV